METLHFSEEERYQATPEALWPLIADTARLNQVIGLQSVSYSYEPRSDGGSLIRGEYRRFGVTFAHWVEHAFDFVRPQGYRILREYSSGPLVSLDGGVELWAEGSRTRVRVFADIVARNFVGALIANKAVGPVSTSRVLAQCRIFESYLAGQEADPFPQLAPQRGIQVRRLNELIDKLCAQGGDENIARRLGEHLRAARTDLVVQMRPFELAEAWGTDGHETLLTFLRATTVGLLDLKWDVLCPNCRISKAEYPALAELAPQAHCETCNIVFDANFDRLVEVRFTVSRSIRAADVGVFCSEGPHTTPHVVAQAEIPPGMTTEWLVDAGSLALRLRSPQSQGTALIDPTVGGVELVELQVAGGVIRPPLVPVVSGPLTIRVTNELGAPAVVFLEEQFWPKKAATAALVSTLQEFRDLFGAEVLAPGLQVGVERVTLLFTDLAGSTALYERIGQAKAFRLVQDHFRIIEAQVRTHRGAIVKTIGDAVMASFSTPADALQAAIAVQRAMAAFDTQGAADPQRLVKMGIHLGPAVVANFNGRLDYFGTTVNIAARAQHEARGGEIILTEVVAAENEVQDILKAGAFTLETNEVNLKGISEATQLVRFFASTSSTAPDSGRSAGI